MIIWSIVFFVLLEISLIKRCKNNFYWLFVIEEIRGEQIKGNLHLNSLWKSLFFEIT